ncbi:MAG: DUF2730 family protein [Alteromonadaceae bacterium]|nr:DUF2730 family protein [Alteromonadaceae bacterium]
MDLAQFDYTAAKLVLDIAQLGGLIGLGLYQHITSKSKANAGAINTVRNDLEKSQGQLEERIARAERRQDVFESRMDSAPTHQDLSKVYDRLNDVAEEMSSVGGHMRALSHQLSMVNQYLLNNKGGQGQ